jgi:hypothetical protein
MPKQVLFSDEARAALLRGVNIMVRVSVHRDHSDRSIAITRIGRS